MQTYTAWIVALVLVVGVAVVQWQILKRRHLKRLAAERAKRHRSEKDTATQLQGAHQQIATLQRELAALREARPGADIAAAPSPQAEREAARQRLDRMLDEAAPPQPPAHGFADTQPADRDTRAAGDGVLLQRSTAGTK
jgi:septal ring factor EnvC (AmiA/AmiB activator)